MDPDTALEVLRQWSTYEPRNPHTDECGREAFAALDGWLSSGGFLPAAWSR